MRITLESPLDMHLHLRDNDILKSVAPLSAKNFSAGLVMPNLVPPITNLEDMLNYKSRIKNALNEEIFDPLMTLFFKNSYDYNFLKRAKKHIMAIKLYPLGVTTNSNDGVKDINIENVKTTLEAMSELEIPLCIHGETDGFVMDREKEFIPIYEKFAKKFPKLKIIMEHITTKESVELLNKYENLYATITLHHLFITLNDILGNELKPHLFCKPIAKREEDRDALLKIALSGSSKVMFGSDSAPHPTHMKECCGCAAGVFTAPIALEGLTTIFDKNSALKYLQAFVSDNAQNIYNYKPKTKKVTLIKKPFEVVSSYANIVPMFAGETLPWSIEEIV